MIPHKAGQIALLYLPVILSISSIVISFFELPANAQVEDFNPSSSNQATDSSVVAELTTSITRNSTAEPTLLVKSIEEEEEVKSIHNITNSDGAESTLVPVRTGLDITTSSPGANLIAHATSVSTATSSTVEHSTLTAHEFTTSSLSSSDSNSIAEFPTPDTDINYNNPMSRVTSVTQLSDVQQGDWAFQALRSLVERYGCLAGQPDGNFDGSRAISRYQFAAGLNTCINRIEELILSATDSIMEVDLITLEQLRREFATELAIFTGRVDLLEARTAQIEANQFSTTTRLSGLAWFNLNGAAFAGDMQRETGDRVVGSRERRIENSEEPSITSSYLVWLELLTSFTGSDSLVLQIAAGNGTPIVSQVVSAGLEFASGADFTNQSGGVAANNLYVRELFYQFPISSGLQLVVAPRVNFFRYFDSSMFSFYPSSRGGFIFNYHTFNSANSTLVNAIDRGAGVIALWNISNQLELRAAYLGENNEYLPRPPFNSATNPNQGLFRGTNTLTAELTYRPSDRADIRLLYTRSNIQQIGGRIGSGGVAEPIYGIADDGFGGPLDNATADTFSIGFDWLVTPELGFFGRYAYGSLNVYPTTIGRAGGEINVQAFQLGLAFPDLGTEGAMGTVSFVIPQHILEGREFLVSGGGDGGTQVEFELNYYFPITDNVAILPSFYIVENPNNFSDNPALFVFNFRTQFSF